MAKRPTFKKFREQVLKNPKIKAEYDLLQPEFNLLQQLITARKAAKLTQSELAKRLSTHQPAIARLETGSFKNTTLSTLVNYAAAVGYQLKINLVKKRRVQDIE